MKTQDTIAVGTRVGYASAFLRNTGQHTGWAPFAKGTVTELHDIGARMHLAVVQWDDQTKPGRVLTSNLWPLDKRHIEPR